MERQRSEGVRDSGLPTLGTRDSELKWRKSERVDGREESRGREALRAATERRRERGRRCAMRLRGVGRAGRLSEGRREVRTAALESRAGRGLGRRRSRGSAAWGWDGGAQGPKARAKMLSEERTKSEV